MVTIKHIIFSTFSWKEGVSKRNSHIIFITNENIFCNTANQQNLILDICFKEIHNHHFLKLTKESDGKKKIGKPNSMCRLTEIR